MAATYPAVEADPVALASPLLAKYASAGTFTADQRFNGKVGIGVAPSYPLHGVNAGNGTTFRFDTALLGGVIQHTSYLSGATGDLLDLINRGTGDNIWLVHMGGHPTSGDVGGAGGNAALNVLIPYHSDVNPLSGTTGRDGSVVNTQQGMRALTIESQAAANTRSAIEHSHHGAGYAWYLDNQDTQSGQVAGGGGGFQMDDWSGTNSLFIVKKTQPGVQRAAVAVKSQWVNSGTSAPASLIELFDDTTTTRGKWLSDGTLTIGDASSVTRAEIRPDGTTAFGSNPLFGTNVRLYATKDATGIQRGLAISNRGASQTPANNDGASIEFTDGGNQYGLIVGKFDKVSAARDGSLRFQVNVGGSVTELLALASSGGVSAATFATNVITNGNVKAQLSAANNTAFWTSSGGNTAFAIEAGGKHRWWDIGVGEDTAANLYRSASGILKMDGSFHVGANFRHLGSNIGFFNTAQAAKQTVTGSRGGNAALASLLTALAAYGLITDSSTA